MLGQVSSCGRVAALAVGAAKAGVGHAEAASGMAGLCKVAQQLRRTVVAGNTKLRVLNPLVRERLGAGGAAVVRRRRGGRVHHLRVPRLRGNIEDEGGTTALALAAAALCGHRRGGRLLWRHLDR